MVRLRNKPKSEQATFYFKTMDECIKFMYVFKDHWCGIEWEEPKEGEFELDTFDNMDINRSPEERAISNLSWGFNLVKSNKLTQDQRKFIDNMVTMLYTGNN